MTTHKVKETNEQTLKRLLSQFCDAYDGSWRHTALRRAYEESMPFLIHYKVEPISTDKPKDQNEK